ncbi:MAG: hypothetical protein WC276_11465 [Sedimentibacter sp.]
MRMEFWEFTNSDIGKWDEKWLQDEVKRFAKACHISIADTGKTRDKGRGKERLYILSGTKKNIERFDLKLNEAILEMEE